MDIQKLGAAALIAASLTLSACGGGAEEAAVEEVDGIPGLEISDARLVLNAVEGNPAAAYFELSYEGERPLSIRAADVAGAQSALLHVYGEYDFKVQMMEALPIPLTKGTKVSFKPGDLHVMAMDVSPDLKPGGTTEVTLIVSGGDKHSFDAEIRGAGEER
jgi:copper(I)-binding protein